MKHIPALLFPLVFAACADPEPPTAPPAAPTTPAPAAAPTARAEVKKPEPAAPRPAVRPGKLTSIGIDRLFPLKQAGKVLVVDVRPPLYYRLGHIEGAGSLPLVKYDKTIAAKRPWLDAAVKGGKHIVLYCQNSHCPDAHKTALKLVKLGYDVSVYRGGWEEWKRAGF